MSCSTSHSKAFIKAASSIRKRQIILVSLKHKIQLVCSNVFNLEARHDAPPRQAGSS